MPNKENQEQYKSELSTEAVSNYITFLDRIEGELRKLDERAKEDTSLLATEQDKQFAEKVHEAINKVSQYFENGGEPDEIAGALTGVYEAGVMLSASGQSKRGYLGTVASVLKSMAVDCVENPLRLIPEYMDNRGDKLQQPVGEAGEEFVRRIATSAGRIYVTSPINHQSVPETLITDEDDEKKALEIAEKFTPEQRQKYEFIKRNNRILAPTRPSLKMTELQMVELTLDTKADEVRDRLKEYAGWNTRCKATYEEATKAFGINPDVSPQIARTVSYEMDTSGTPEAKQKNIDFLKTLMTREGQTKYAEQVVRDILDTPLETFCPRNDEEVIAKCIENPKKLMYGFVVGDMINSTESSLKIDPELMKLLEDRLVTMQGAGQLMNRGGFLGSVYNGTLPPMEGEDYIFASQAFSVHLQQHLEEIEKYGLIPAQNNSDALMDNLMNFALVKDNFYSENRNIMEYAYLAGLTETKTPISMIDGKEIKVIDGKEVEVIVPFKDVINKIATRQDNCAIIRSDNRENVRKLLDGETVNKEQNSIDYAKKYDEDKALREAIDREYKERSKDIAETISSLESVAKQQGVSLNNNANLSLFVALVEDESGNLVKRQLFTESGEPATTDLPDRIGKQQTVTLMSDGSIDTALSKQRIMEIDDLLRAGKVFVEVPGQKFDMAKHVYVQEDGMVGIAAPKTAAPGQVAAEPAYYGRDTAVLERNRNLGAELRGKMIASEKDAYLKLNAQDKKLDAEIMAAQVTDYNRERKKNFDAEKVWEAARGSCIITDKMIDFVDKCGMYGLNIEDVDAAYHTLNRDFSDEKYEELNLNGTFAEEAFSIRLKKLDKEEEISRHKLTAEARELCMQLIVDKHNKVDMMDDSDPDLRAIQQDRTLKAILLDNTAPLETNITIAKRWAAGDTNERAKLINESLQRMLDVDYSKFKLDISDEELVANFKEFYERTAGLNEIEVGFNYLDSKGIEVGAELREKALNARDFMSAKSVTYNARMSMICSALYSKIETHDVLFKPEELETIGEVTVDQIDEPEVTRFFSAANMLTRSYSTAICEDIMSRFKPDILSGKSSGHAIYDANGENVDVAEIYNRALAGETLYFGTEGNADVRAFKLDTKNFGMVEELTDPKVKNNIMRINSGIEADKYIANRHSDPRQVIAQDPYYGRGLQKTCKELYAIVDGADSIFVHSSKEFRGIKNELDTIANQDSVPNPYQAQAAVEKIHRLAATYIANKDSLKAEGKVFSAREEKRYNAINEILNKTESMLATYSEAARGGFRLGGRRNDEIVAEQAAPEERKVEVAAPEEVKAEKQTEFESFEMFYAIRQSAPDTDYKTRIVCGALRELVLRERLGNTAVNDGPFEKLVNKYCQEGKIDKVVEVFESIPSIARFIEKHPQTEENLAKAAEGNLTNGIGADVMKDIQAAGLKSLLGKIEPTKTLEKSNDVRTI